MGPYTFDLLSCLIVSSRFYRSLPQPRLKCLIHIVKRLGEEHKDFITALLPEVQTHINACKQANTKSTEVYRLHEVVLCFRSLFVPRKCRSERVRTPTVCWWK